MSLEKRHWKCYVTGLFLHDCGLPRIRSLWKQPTWQSDDWLWILRPVLAGHGWKHPHLAVRFWPNIAQIEWKTFKNCTLPLYRRLTLLIFSSASHKLQSHSDVVTQYSWKSVSLCPWGLVSMLLLDFCLDTRHPPDTCWFAGIFWHPTKSWCDSPLYTLNQISPVLPWLQHNFKPCIDRNVIPLCLSCKEPSQNHYVLCKHLAYYLLPIISFRVHCRVQYTCLWYLAFLKTGQSPLNLRRVHAKFTHATTQATPHASHRMENCGYLPYMEPFGIQCCVHTACGWPDRNQAPQACLPHNSCLYLHTFGATPIFFFQATALCTAPGRSPDCSTICSFPAGSLQRLDKEQPGNSCKMQTARCAGTMHKISTSSLGIRSK